MSAAEGGRVLHRLLARRARETPARPFLVEAARSLSYAEADRAADALARGLRDLGVRAGDRVLSMMPGGMDTVLLWMALGRLNAVLVPVNEHYFGVLLAHVIEDSGASLMIVEAGWAHRVAMLEPLPDLRAVVVRGDAVNDDPLPWPVRRFEQLATPGDAPVDEGARDGDIAAVFYTSGTTGPSKGVLHRHAQGWATAEPWAAQLEPADVFYLFNPLYHVVLPHAVGAVLMAGASLALRPCFDAQAFWDDVRRFGATATLMLGAVARRLEAVPPSPLDRDHPLRLVFAVPLPPDLDAFRERFGVALFTWFNMTETSTPIHSHGSALPDRTVCGRVRSGALVRVVDEDGLDVPDGTPGELLVRTADPVEMNGGYLNRPDATAAAWRDGWFRTGDLVVRGADGWIRYLDRLGDRIRVRGENVSSSDIETAAGRFPGVAECAAVAVPAAEGEDDILLVVGMQPGARVDPAALCRWLAGELPRWMVPRWVRLVESALPKTPTGKIRKGELRTAGIADAWQRSSNRRENA